jgi:large subunit ribosomal protein L6
MSRIGKKPVLVPKGVKVELKDRAIKVSGPKGEQAWQFPAGITVEFDTAKSVIHVTRGSDEKRDRAMHGLTRALIQNMVHGVEKGYERRLEIYGTGYSCKLQGKQLHLNVGFMGRGFEKPAQFMIDVPAGLTVDVEVPAARGESEPAKFVIRGASKQLVGEFAAEIRGLRPPEPYQGKGIRYQGEYVRRKQGKAYASGTGS